MERFETSYGCIRWWLDGDAPSLAKYANNRNVWRNMSDGFPSPYTDESARAFLASVAKQQPRTYFALATESEAIGGIGLIPGSDVYRRSAELGYWLAEPFWGRGFTVEAIRAITRFGFERLDLLRIYARPYAPNLASRRVLEKAGFQLEGICRQAVIKDGQVLDQCLYAILRSPTAP